MKTRRRSPTRVAFIFARGGSKGLPSKNLKQVAGQSLVVRAVERAGAVPGIEEVFVSTDSVDIADEALLAGATVPFVRPAELASDDSPELESWKHAIHWFTEARTPLPGAFLVVPTTSPLALPSDVQSCLVEWQRSDLDVVLTLTESHRNPFFNMVKSDGDRCFSLACAGQGQYWNRQSAPEVYDICTVAYAANPTYIVNTSHLLLGRIGGVLVPKSRSLDIDSAWDLQLARLLAANGAGGSSIEDSE